MTIRVSLTYTDIHSHPLSIFPLPVCVFSDCGKVDDAVRAYQLCLHLLEPAGRDELRRLLAFMATAAHPDACRLHKQVFPLHTHHLKTIVSQIMGQGPMINTSVVGQSYPAMAAVGVGFCFSQSGNTGGPLCDGPLNMSRQTTGPWSAGHF